LSAAIAEKELLRSLIEIGAALALGEPEAGVALDGVVVLVVLELQAATSSAAAAAAAVSPARADTEYNGVPRSFTSNMPLGMCETRSV
jgi:hypothetical protein